MKFSIVLKIFNFLILISLSGCQTKELSPFEKAKNPYAQIGVEGYMGAAMSSCMGMAPPGPPVVRKKDGATVSNDDHFPEQASYFDCVDREVYKVEQRKADKDPD